MPDAPSCSRASQGKSRSSAAASCSTADRSSRTSIADRIANGVGLVPEDRQRDGLVQTFDVGTNLTLASLDGASSTGSSLAGAEKSGRRADQAGHSQDARAGVADRCTLGRQSAEGRDRQDHRDPATRDAARRAEYEGSTSVAKGEVFRLLARARPRRVSPSSTPPPRSANASASPTGSS